MFKTIYDENSYLFVFDSLNFKPSIFFRWQNDSIKMHQQIYKSCVIRHQLSMSNVHQIRIAGFSIVNSHLFDDMTDMKSKSVFKIMFSKWWRLVLRLRKKIEIRKTENNFSCQNVENGLHLPSKHVWAWIPVWCLRVRVFNATFKNISIISWWLFLLVEEKGVPGENHRPVASHWQTISHDVV
jgi:hypothetical protein